MDDKRIKELLETAGKEYNLGKYAEAIAHWHEVLALDPGQQKAKEGIRMAQLLVVNWEATETDADDSAALLPAGATDAETQEKIDIGIARVRELMSTGRYQEALEGCQLLAEIAPHMDSVRQLHEEVSQAHEAQPFVKERLERAKRFLQQGKTREAAEEARNVLSVDDANQQARAILEKVTGRPGDKAKVPSAFQVEKGGKKDLPPSPFKGRAGEKTDALLAQFEFEPDAPAGAGAASPLDLEATAPGAQGAPPDAEARVAALIAEGEKLLGQKKPQAAIDVLSRIYAISESHVQAGVLIDRAKAVLEDIARRADESYFRAVDALESGRLPEAKKAFLEVIALQPEHPDARGYLDQIAEREAAAPAHPEAPAPAPSAPAAKPAASKSPIGSKAPRPSDAEMLSSESVPLAVPHDEHPSRGSSGHASAPSVSAGVMKRKPIVPVVKRNPLTMVLGGALAAVLLLAAGVGYFVLRGEPARPEPESASARPAVPPAPTPAGVEGPGDPATGAPPRKAGSLEILPGAQGPQPPKATAPDPAAVRRKIDALMKEGRALARDEKYPEAVDRFDQILALDPANFEAADARSKAAALQQKWAKFYKELDAAKGAFKDSDWAGALYKLYRLREERKDMAILPRYIENANYNWGLETLSGFEIENAVDHFKDALEMDPGDASIQKHIEFASHYKRHGRDAAFDVYVKSLKRRDLEER
ncbi:MAG: hypothetical protein HY049_07380 [Acidobacteria bacterium]|nr:hypothetical protein [Acidobacteriota bacterium]